MSGFDTLNEILLFVAGVYTLALIVFHLLFGRIFGWPKSLSGLDPVNRSTMQVLNLSITFILGIFAWLSFFHADELLDTELGRTLLILVSALWLFRAGLQIWFYGLGHKLSFGLFGYFLLGAVLYGMPLVV